MFSALALQIGGVGGSDRPGGGVVEVAEFGGDVAVWKPACQIAGPDELGESLRRSVPRLRLVQRTPKMPHRRARADQLSQQWPGNHAATENDRTRRRSRGFGLRLRRRKIEKVHVAGDRSTLGLSGQVRIRLSLQRGAFRQNVNHHRTRGPTGRRSLAGRRTAEARQLLAARRERAQRIGAALGQGTRIVLADTARHLHQPPFQDRCVGRVEPSPHRRGAGGVVAAADLDVAVAREGPDAPQSPRIETVHPHIDRLLQFAVGQWSPGARVIGDSSVDSGKGLLVLHEFGAPDDGGHDAIAEHAVGEQRGDLRQPAVQRHAEMHLAGGPSLAESQRRCHFGGRGIPRVAGPQRPVVIPAAAAGQFGDRRQSTRGSRGLGAGPLLDRGDDGRVVGGSQTRIEHVFYSAPGVRQVRGGACRRPATKTRPHRTRIAVLSH